MHALLLEYIGLSLGESAVALLLSSALFIAGLFFLRNRELLKEISQLRLQVAQIALDRESLFAFQRSVEEEGHLDVTLSKESTQGKNSLLQQELEAYLLQKAQEDSLAEEAFMDLSAGFVDFLRVKAGKIELEVVPFSLDTLFNELSISLRSQMARTGVELVFDIAADIPPKLTGDKSHIRLLLFHIISNVIHNAVTSQLVLEVKCHKDGASVTLYLAINGMHLEALSDESQLFVPFSGDGVDESMQIEFYIAKQLSKMMEGDVKAILNSINEVSFQIELHLKASDPYEKRYYHLPSRTMIGHKILIVNDNTVLAKSIKNMYEYFQNEVSILLNSDFENNVDVITAYHTTVIDKGALTLSVLEKIRAIKRAEKSNVVALLSAKDVVSYEMPYGAVEQLLVKPVTIQNVFNTIIAFENSSDEAQGIQEGVSNFDTTLFQVYEGRRVLCIESERRTQKVFLKLLRSSGINISMTKTAQEGLWMLEKMPTFDLVLIGEELNDEAKISLTEKIRAMRRYKAVPVIVMAKVTPVEVAPGVDQYLKKPIDGSNLNIFFRHYLGTEQSASVLEEKMRPKAGYINSVSLAARNGYEMASYDEVLYSDILKEFMKMYGDSAQKMNAALVKDDLSGVQKMCLDIKGVSANIGALRLSSIAAQIHAAITKGKAKDLMLLVNQYQPELKNVKKEIEAYLQTKPL